MLLGRSRNAFEDVRQKFSSYSCCKCEQMSVPEGSKQVTFIHGTYLFNVYLITVYLMHDVHHILTQKQCEGFMLNFKANQRLFYFQFLWINFTCFLSVQVQLTEGYDYAGTLWIEGKKGTPILSKISRFPWQLNECEFSSLSLSLKAEWVFCWQGLKGSLAILVHFFLMLY